ncbi:hypothetical protein VPH35_102368 [Triticum aestivum]
MLLQILVRLQCARDAARTGVLSRRWRGLWAGFPGLTFRDVPADQVKAALACVPRRTAVSLLNVCLTRSVLETSCKLDDARAKSLLRTAERLSPEELIFILPRETLDTGFLRIKLPQTGCELPVLERLSLSGNIGDIGAFLNRCPRLCVLGVIFREVEPDSLEVALTTLEAAVVLGLTVCLLGIEYNRINMRRNVDTLPFASLLRAAVRLSPQEVVFTHDSFKCINIDLPWFHCATSIEMKLYAFRFTQLPAKKFSALERLCLTGCTILNLVTMVTLCPRLRVLKVKADRFARDVIINSESLHELFLSVYGNTKCQSIQIMIPLLKQVKLDVLSSSDLSMSISAPNNRLGAALDFEWEMEELTTTNFTVLELHLTACLINTWAGEWEFAQGLACSKYIVMFLMLQSKCLENCHCDEPKNWRSQNISLTHLEEVEITNFKGVDHEIDFMKMTLRWTPRLNTMTINLAHEADIGCCAMNIYNISLAYPSINCFVYRCSGGLVQRTCI